MQGIDYALWWLTASFSAIALFRFLALRFWTVSHFRAFAVMLAVGLSRDVALAGIPYSSHSYGTVWGITLPLLLLAHIYAVLATYRSIAQLYPKIGDAATRLFAASLTAAAVACLGTLYWEVQRIGASGRQFLHSMFLLYHWIDGLAAGAIVLACAFLAFFPRPMKVMPANLKRHTALLAAYFSAYSLTFLAENLIPNESPAWIATLMERCLFALVALLYAFWTLAISAQGEKSEPWPEFSEEIASRIETKVALARQAAK